MSTAEHVAFQHLQLRVKKGFKVKVVPLYCLGVSHANDYPSAHFGHHLLTLMLYLNEFLSTVEQKIRMW